MQVYGILNIRAFARDLRETLGEGKFTIQKRGPSVRNASEGNSCRILTYNSAILEKLKGFLKKEQVPHSNWAAKSNRLSSYVIKGLSVTTLPEEILEDLEGKGIPVRKVHQLRDALVLALTASKYISFGTNISSYSP